MFHDANNWSKTLDDSSIQSNTGIIEPWTGLDQPWPQPGRDPGRLSVGPAHSPDGGAGFDSPSNASELTSVVNPVVNWMYGSYSVSTDALGTPIADMKGQLTTEPDAEQRCGGSSLYTILIQTVSVSGSDHSFLRIIEGEDASLAWEVDLGATEIVKASPLVVDMDDDGKQEIIVVYDAAGTLHVDAWSPQLECSVTGWSSGGSHSSELLWTYTDDSLMISSTNAPYALTEAAGHLPTTQPLLADLDLDGDAELVIAAIDEVSESPVVIALPLGVNGVPTTIWESTLQDGSHPSDPAFAQIDEDTGYVLLTSTLASSGAMWVWKLDSETGDQKWGGLSLSNLDGDSDVPHIRLPGPIIAELDGTSGPEMVITIPTDADGATGVDGAEYRGLEIDDGTELWSFEAVNGFADAPPIMIDTDEDDVHDRACWVTWYQSTWDRHGLAGCHDVTTTNPQLEWYHELERSSGNLNDEIAVSQPVWMDIDGNEIPELLVAYGRTLWAWDGDTGTQAAINSDWTNEVNLEHRTWSSPAFADIDGDATLDVVLGDTVVTTELADLRPLLDGRSIEF
ncbi:MAG TPA: VCBS repeat-containing protein, partial [Candidatus Thalassarchaeaceae archaeon]|nr:VCBS repeat-containing protein [Candidatus Thalassarchaeaceae archaeon]